MGEDRRYNGNTRYLEEGMKRYKAFMKCRNERKSSKGIFTQETVERIMEEER